MFEHWRAIEADFWRFYRVRPLSCSWRRFKTFLVGLPAESALGSALAEQAEDRDAWRSHLSRATGRDYSAPRAVITLDDYTKRGV